MTSGETKNKMEGRRSEQHITDPCNTRTEETRRTQTGMKASSEAGQGPGGTAAP